MKTIYYISLLYTLLFSCTNSNQEGIDTVSLDRPENVFIQNDKLVIPLDSVGKTSSYYTTVETEGERYLGLVNYNINAIELYEIEKGALYKRIVFPKEGDKGIGIMTGFYWHNKDSIFTISNLSSGNKVALVNAAGEFVQTIIARNIGEEFGIFSYSDRPIYFLDGYIYNPREWLGWNDGAPEKNLEVKGNVEDIINVSDGSKKEIYSQFPPSVAKGYMTHNRVKGAGNQMVYSFCHDHNLYTLQLDSKEGLRPHFAATKSNKEIETLNQDASDPETFYKWFFNNVNYEDVYYNPWLEVYYRFATQPTGESKDPVTDKRLDWQYQVPFSIIVLNKNFEVIGEELFPASRYNYNSSCFVHPKGLYVSLNNPFNEEVQEDEIVFQLLELRPEILAKTK